MSFLSPIGFCFHNHMQNHTQMPTITLKLLRSPLILFLNSTCHHFKYYILFISLFISHHFYNPRVGISTEPQSDYHGVLINLLSKKKKKVWCIVFANIHSVNSPTLPLWPILSYQLNAEYLITSSCKPSWLQYSTVCLWHWVSYLVS